MYYVDILRKFHELNIEYLIIGGLAVNLHGIPRVTQDIDIVISTNSSNIEAIIRAMNELGYTPKMPGVMAEDLNDDKKIEEWINERNMKAFCFHHTLKPFQEIDILLSHSLDFENAYKKRLVKSAEGFDISIVSMDDLIKLKKESGRAQDLSDIEMLRKAKEWTDEE
jgi:hypothetical protein